jgi:hypothetical protein
MAFKKGQSGNPAGRPAGGVNKVTRLREQIAEALPEIIRGLIVQARTGDSGAAKLLLERAIPALKPQTEPVVLNVSGKDSPSDIGRLIVDMTSRGEITPDNSALLLSALSTQVKLTEADELAARVHELEKLLNSSQTGV